MSEQPELTSWKEIAAYLKVSVRTAQEWEKKRGLPVQRLPGGRGRVAARTADLDRWARNHPSEMDVASKAEEPVVQPEATPAYRYSRRGILTAGVLAISTVFVVTLLLRGSDSIPSTWKVVEQSLVIADTEGRELWRHEFSEPLDQTFYKNATENAATIAWIGDLDSDGSREILFVRHTSPPSKESTPLICFSADGKKRWRFVPGRTVKTNTEEFPATFTTNTFKVERLEAGAPMSVILASNHSLYYPAQLAVVSARGELVQEYWHSGHLGAFPATLQLQDLDGNGVQELYAGGMSNSRELGTLVVLDPKTMEGASAEDDPAYQLQGFASANEKARIFFPKSSLTIERFNGVHHIAPSENTMTVSVRQSSLQPESPPVLLYEFDKDLSLRSVRSSDVFLAFFERLQRVGKPTIAEELQRVRNITSLKIDGGR